MSTSLPMLMPTQATGGGETASLPVNTTVDDSSQAFANVLSAHFQPEGTADTADFMPLTVLENSSLNPLLSINAVDGQILNEEGKVLPLDLGQLELLDGNALPLAPELIWSGMLIVNDSDAASPQLYQLSEDGQSLTSHIDPNMRAQLNRAMNRFAPLTSTEMPEILNFTSNQSPGMNEQSIFFSATGTNAAADAMAAQKFSALLPAALLTGADEGLLALSNGDASTQGIQALGLGTGGDMNSGRLPEMSQLLLSGAPKSAVWAQGLGERVQWLVQQDIQGAEIRLNPPELGALEVKLKLNGEQGTHIHFTSPNGAVREALEAAIPRLREMFAEAGLSLGDVNVSHQSFAEQQQSGETGGDGNGRSSRDLASPEPGSGEDHASQGRLVSESLVDMYV